MTVLRTEIDVAARRPRSEQESHELLGRLRSQVERLVMVVDNLLFLARADARGLSSRAERFRLAAAVAESTEAVRPLALARSVAVHVGRTDDVWVQGDESQVRRLLDNLLTNAVKFTPPGGSVTAGLVLEESRFRLTISDTGTGIPPEELPFVFDRFYRIDRSRSASSGGAGLGLSIVREIASVHGFDVHLDSFPHKGTSVHVAGASVSRP